MSQGRTSRPRGPESLFFRYDVSADGQRLLVVKSTREPVRTKLHVIQNWFTELNRLVPGD